jgi:amidase
VARSLTESGAIVEQAELPLTDFAQELSQAGALIGMVVGAAQPGATKPTLPVYMQALQRRDASIAAWDGFFDRWDALLCAPCMTSAFPHCQPGSPIVVDGATVDYWMVSAHTAVFNYSGNPAVVVPCGLDHSGLPVGVQLVGKRWSDSRLLAIAKVVSEVSGGFQPPA